MTYRRQRIDGAFFVALAGIPVRGPFLSVRDAIVEARARYPDRRWTIHRNDRVAYTIGPAGKRTGNKRHHWEVRANTNGSIGSAAAWTRGSRSGDL